MSVIAASFVVRAVAGANEAANSTAGTGSGASNGTAAAAAAGAGAVAAGGGAGAAPAGLSDFQIVWDIDIILLSIIALLFLLRLPRFLARLYRFSEWTSGLVLRNRPYHTRTSASRRVQFSVGNNSSMNDLSTDESHVMYQDKMSAQRTPQVQGGIASSAYPPHVSNCPTFFRPLLKLLHARVNTGVSFSHMAMMIVWTGAVVFPAFYMTEAFTDPVRFGWITASQLPFVYAFGTKNNVLGMFLGIGYEKINFMHRHAGRIVLIAVNVHGLGYIYKWCLSSNFQEEIANPKCYWGLIGMICIDGLFLFSTEFVRKKAYNVFLLTHISALAVLIIAMLNHFAGTIPWAYACAAFYLLDLLLRLTKTRFSTANLRAIPELGVTRVEIPNINSGWRAGQHVRLRVLSSGMGLLGWSEVHPFTIASVAEGPEGMVLLCKKAGSWTNTLYKMANSSSSDEEGNGRRVLVMVQGPYGGLGNCMIPSFSAATFVCGGSGITLATSAMQELIQKDLNGESRVKSIELIWTVQDASALVPLLPFFTSLIQQSVFTPIRISVFYTRAPIGKFPFPDNFFRSTSLTLSPGRPKFHQHLEETITRTIGSNSSSGNSIGTHGLFVGVCGPVSLADGVFVDAGKIDPYRRDQIGGVEVHAETFGW
ncbi:ferric reductase like transmembrane component-domain-containing protein [Lentinula raphanica]|nr:ferric reductase like transmembrane component-domain-containing protein [Lentinula raphanica]